MKLHLYGTLSFIDRHNKLNFWIDNPAHISDTLTKLTNHNINHDKYFKVSVPLRLLIHMPEFASMVGSYCSVHVVVIPYKFKSTLEHNYGEIITGKQLILSEITVHSI